MKKHPVRGDIIEVKWKDATSSEGWAYEWLKQDDGLQECRTVGYFLRRTRKSLQLAPTVSDETPVGTADTWSIPVGCITEVTWLKRKS